MSELTDPPFDTRESSAVDADDPAWDGTGAAHPAWWRGEKHGFDAAMRMIQKALSEKPAGVISNKKWQALRERVHAMANPRTTRHGEPSVLCNRVAELVGRFSQTPWPAKSIEEVAAGLEGSYEKIFLSGRDCRIILWALENQMAHL